MNSILLVCGLTFSLASQSEEYQNSPEQIKKVPSKKLDLYKVIPVTKQSILPSAPPSENDKKEYEPRDPFESQRRAEEVEVIERNISIKESLTPKR